MNGYHRKGMIVCGLFACWPAYTNWNGDVAVALSTVFGGVLIGFIIGHLIYKGGG